MKKLFAIFTIAAIGAPLAAAPRPSSKPTSAPNNLQRQHDQLELNQSLAAVTRHEGATLAGQKEILRLLRLGASPAWNQSEAFDWAIYYGDLTVLNAFARTKAPLPPRPFSMVYYEDKKAPVTYKWLLNYGAKPDFYALQDAVSSEVAPDRLLKMLLDAGADPNSRGWWNYVNEEKVWATPLMVAAQKAGTPGYTGIQYSDGRLITMLLARGAHIETRTKDGRSALDFAMLEGFVNTVNARALLQHGASITSGIVPRLLQEAATWNEPVIIEELAKRQRLPRKLSFVALGFPYGAGVIKQLLLYGADPKEADKKGWTALHQAAVYSEVTSVQALLDAGANIEAKGTGSDISGTILDGATPVFTADTMGVLKNNPVQRLLSERGANANAQDNNGVTPLIFAALGSDRGHGSEEATQLLCENGANLTLKDKHGSNALHYAVIWSLPIVKTLLHSNSNSQFLEESNGDGNSAFLEAMSRPLYTRGEDSETSETFPIARALIKAGAKTDATDREGNNVFHLAQINDGRLPFLLGLKLNCDRPNTLGYTPLYRACFNGDVETATLLLRHGANPDFKAKDGTSPQLVASQPFGSSNTTLTAAQRHRMEAAAKAYGVEQKILFQMAKPEIDKGRKAIAGLLKKATVIKRN